MTDHLRRIICLILAFALTVNPVLASAGGITADQAAPKGSRPDLTAAPNGVPMVNIAKPNGRGLSHNMYDEFNVGGSGVIMNNSKKVGRSRLGGVVAGNPNLGSGHEARTVLNEVTGGSRSRIEGYTEIFGHPADYILANPNGVTINGGGFINTPRATVTTGRPRFDATGGLQALDVRRGDVLVEGEGLNAANLDAFDIVSRAAAINAAIYAQDIAVTTGHGSYDPATGQFSDLTPDGSPAPAVAIDSSALGGIYADRIKLVGNEKGLGINLDGIVRATDQLVLRADGRICVKGAASSDNDLSAASASDGIDISSSLAAGKTAMVHAARDVRLAPGSGDEAPLLYAPDLSIAAGTLDNGGKILADGGLKAVVSGDIANSGTLSSGSGASLETGGSVRNQGQIQAGQNLQIVAQAMVENPGKIHSAGTTTIRSDSVANSGAILSLGPVKIHSAREVSNTGRIAANGQVTIAAGALANDGRVTSGQELAIDLSGGLDNSGTIHSDSEVGIRAEVLFNDRDAVIQGLGDISIETRAGLENRGIVNSAEGVAIQTGGTMSNAGGNILAQSGMELAALEGLENSGLIQSGGTGTFRSSGALCNTGEILTGGDSAFDVSGRLSNTGNLHSGATSAFDLGGDLRNDGEILARGNLGLTLAGRLDNFGLMASDADASLAVGGILFNAMGGEILAFGAADFDVDGDLLNSGRIESNAPGSFEVDGTLVNEADGSILSEDGLDFGVSGSVRNDGIVHSGGSLDLTSASLDNAGQILAQGDSAVTISKDLVNTNLLFAGGASTFSLGGMLRNIRGNILSLKDMLLQGLDAESPMAELLNESGTIETLEGSMAIRAKVVRNANLDFTLTPGAEILSRRGGIYSFFSDNWDQARDLYDMLPDSAEVKAGRDALIIMTSELQLIGLDANRNVFTSEEIDAAVTATEARFAEAGATTEEIEALDLLKERMSKSEPHLLIKHKARRSKVAGYIEEITRDQASGFAGGGVIAAAADLDIESMEFQNSVSRVSTVSGDIAIRSASFENSGQDIFETRTVDWIRGHANEHESPRLSPEGKGTEVVKTPIAHAYGTISAGGTVSISAEHLENGISGNAGVASGGGRDVRYEGGVGSQTAVVAPPRPEDLAQNIDDIEDFIGNLPKDGLFSVNRDPGHRYLIETNPALTSLARFYGSDYFLNQTGIDLGKTQQRLLGDAFYETRLVRDQIFALTGRRLLSSALSSDTEQMLALMDNALAAREDLALSVGVALTGEQIAALATDIVWLVTRVVDGQEVLVPVVYLCRNSLDTVARGGSVIIGNDVDIRTTGDTTNRGVIKAAGNLAINAGNIFNTFGTIEGDTLNLAAADSIVNTSGLVRGRDVALSAGQDIISTTATTTFSTDETLRRAFRLNPFSSDGRAAAPVFLGTLSTVRSTSETVGQRGLIEATGDLSMRAGRDVAVVGSDVKAGGDATIEAGRDVVIADQTLESSDKGKTRSSSSQYKIQTSKASNVEAGGSVTIDAGRDATVRGSHVAAGQDVEIDAGDDVTIASGTEGEKYQYKQKSKGGVFGTSKALSVNSKTTDNAESTITAENRIDVEAGKDGDGSLTVAGSTLKSGGDMSLRAEDDIQILPAQTENYSKVEKKESGFMGTGSMKFDESQGVTNVRSELNAYGKIALEAGDSVILQSARITSGDEISITAENSQVAMLAAKDFFFERHVESDTGYFSWSSTDKGTQDEKVQHTEISAGKRLNIITANGVVVQYKETGNIRQDIEQLAQAPGLGWMSELLKRDDINWQAVQEVHNKWKHEDSGVGGPGVQLVALAIAVALTVTGVGTAFATWATGINTATGTTLTATQLAVHSAVAAGFNSLVSQASVQLVANQGDVGAVLKAMTTEDTVRSLATVMLAAGLTNGLMNAAGVTSDPALLSQAKDMTDVMNILSEELQRAAIRGVVSAGVDTTINGGDLGQNLAYQMQAAGVAVLGSQGARAIGTAFKDQKIGTATKYIAHAALGGTMDLAMGGDGKSGALGAVAGELIADTYVNAWIGEKISQTEDYKKLSGDELRKELDKLDVEIAELRRRGVDLARLGAGMAAALTGGDIDIAAQTGGNAAEHNALPIVLIILGVCEAVDVGVKLYNAYKLAEAIQDQDEAGIEYYGTEILIDTAVDAAPLGAVFTKLGMTKVGGIIMGLGAKVGGDVSSAVAKLEQKYGDNVWTSAGKTGIDSAIRHWNDHAADFPELKSFDEYVDHAHDFLKKPPNGTLTKIRDNGDIIRYNPSSNTFGVMNSDGIPRTIFKPKDGYDYWIRQK